MRVRMVTGISGGRGDGTPWPPPGGELDVGDEEGAQLCAAGHAVPVAVPEPVEKAVMPPAAEERAAVKPARTHGKAS